MLKTAMPSKWSFPMIEVKPVEVVIGTSLRRDLIERIKVLDPRIIVRDVASHFVEEWPEALRPGQLPPRPSSEPDFTTVLHNAEVLLSPRKMPSDILERMPNLRWTQAVTAGVDFLDNTGIAHSRVSLTSAAGINASAVAEYVMAGILYFAKDVKRIFSSQRKHYWDRFDLSEINGRTLGLLGVGAVGSRVAHLASAFDMRVLAIRRSVDQVHPDIETVWGMERINDFLPLIDYLVIALPETHSTRFLIKEEHLRTMSPDAILINVARGSIVDEAALIKALRSKWIRGAVLDVFEQEPLSVQHPFWSMKNLLLSSHVAGLFDQYDNRVVHLFCDNLLRYLNGKPLRNLV